MCRDLMRFVSLALCAVLGAFTLSAAAFHVPTDEELRSQSDAIVRGHVISHYSFYGADGLPHTTWNVKVEEGFRGGMSPGNFVRVTELGGIIDGKGLVTSSAPAFIPQEDVLLFLRRRPAGGWSTLHGPFGKFSFRKAADGTEWLIRNSPGALLVPRKMRETNVARRANVFLSWLRTGVRPLTASKSSAVVGESPHPYVITPDEYMYQVCPTSEPCHPARWKVFDSDGAIVMQTSGTQPGYSNPLGTLDSAMAAWTNDPGSRVRIIRSGTNTVAFGGNADNLNTVVFNSDYVANKGYWVETRFWVSGTHQAFNQTFYTIDETDVGFASNPSGPPTQTEFAESLTWGLGLGLGFKIDNSAAGANDSNSVMYGYITGTFGASIGPFDQQALAAVYPSTAPPIIRSFTAYPTTIRNGQTSTLLWSTENTTSVSINQDIGTKPTSGSVNVSPSSDTTYTLSATGPSGTATATTTVTVLNQPEVIVTNLPRSLNQDSGVGGATATFALQNIGGASTSISLSRNGSFFSVSPSSFSLPAGASQTITITGSSVSTGAYRGTVTVSGSGVRSGTTVPVTLIAMMPPAGPTMCKADVARVDVNAAVGSNPTGTAKFTNTSAYTLQGTLVSDVPWIIPQPGVITIGAGQTVTVSFSIDRSLIPDGSDDVGSRSGTLSIVYASGSTAKGSNSTRASTSWLTEGTTIVDTSTPSVSSASIPNLTPDQVAYFVPGVGHVLGGQGLYISDLAFTNLTSSALPNRVDMYYTPLGSGTSTPLTSKLDTIKAQQPIALADVVKNVFDQDSQIGTVQLRSSSINQLSVNANILNVSNPDGTYGTTIPVLRSDRSVGPGGSIVLVDVRTSNTYHTNMYIQETAGGTVNVTTTYYNAAGTSLGTRTDTVGPFQLASVTDLGNARLPSGTVTMVLQSSLDSTGKFSAYATPVDNFSADFWAIVDWNHQFGLNGSDPLLVPNVGSLHGANETFFRTDVALFNNGTSQATGVAVYHYTDLTTGQKGAISKNIAISAKQSMILSDVATSLFALSNPSIGYIVFTPQSGKFNLTSRTYATVGSSTKTFGTGVTTLADSGGAKLGDVVRMGGIEDASTASVNNKVPGSFRSNGFLLESGGGTVTVRVTLYFPVASTGLAQASGIASHQYTLGPGDFLQLGGIAGQIIGSSRSTLGDLHNMQIEFAVVSGDGALTPFVTSVDNGTGDTILRTE